MVEDDCANDERKPQEQFRNYFKNFKLFLQVNSFIPIPTI